MATRVSLCLIVKNGEATLPTCLRSVADLVAEMIVVDTGSTDRTKEIAALGPSFALDALTSRPGISRATGFVQQGGRDRVPGVTGPYCPASRSVCSN